MAQRQHRKQLDQAAADLKALQRDVEEAQRLPTPQRAPVQREKSARRVLRLVLRAVSCENAR